MSVTRTPIHQCQCEQCQQHPHSDVAKQHRAINRLLAQLDEKSRRRLAGLLASRHRHGGVQALHQITGLSRMTIRRGRDEIQRIDRTQGIRRVGGGRIPVEKNILAY
jgi:hypothetical protein